MADRNTIYGIKCKLEVDWTQRLVLWAASSATSWGVQGTLGLSSRLRFPLRQALMIILSTRPFAKRLMLEVLAPRVGFEPTT